MLAFLNKLGIGAKLTIWFLLVALVPLLVAGTWAVRHSVSTLEMEVKTNLVSTMNAKAQRVNSYFTEVRHNIETLAKIPSVIDGLAGSGSTSNHSEVNPMQNADLDKGLRPYLTYYQTYFEEQDRFDDLFLISLEGDILFSVKKENDFDANLLTGKYQDRGLAKAFRTAAKAHVTDISDFRYYEPSGKPAGFIATPVFQNEQLIGVVALQISMGEIDAIAGDYRGLGSSGETLLVSKENDGLIFITPLRYDQTAAFARKVKFGSTDALPAQDSLHGRKGSGISKDYRGEEILAAWCYLPEVRWGIVVKQDTKEAFASARALQNSFLAFAIITTLVVAAAALLVSRSISGPIGHLIGSVHRIAGGNFKERVQVSSADEIGRLGSEFNRMTERLETNIAELSEQESRMRTILNSTADGIITVSEDGTVTSFNAAAQQLFGYRPDEVIGGSVSRIVPSLAWKPETENLHSLPAKGELRELGGEWESEGLHRDGHAIPLALRVAEMNFRGERSFIATLQDIAERKSNEQQRERLFAGIRDAVAALTKASSNILGSASRLTGSARQQASLVSETTSSVAEVKQSAQQALGLAKDVAGSAHLADEVSEAGRIAVGNTVAAMNELHEYSASIAASILSLAERAQAIADITGMVDEFSEQTNVLALNAAIEASRAGKHGRGFAVVAREVKSLAEQSRSATQQIRQILSEVREATSRSVISTESGTHSLDRAGNVLAEADETINSLSETISDAARAAVKIVASFSQQATAISQISESMTQIDQEAQHALKANRQAEQLAEDLNELGKRLTELIEQRE